MADMSRSDYLRFKVSELSRGTPGQVKAGVSVWFLLGSSKVPVTYLGETIQEPKKKYGVIPVLILGRTEAGGTGDWDKVSG